LPEIALTTQLIQRLSRYFGNQVGVYHSRFNQNERVEIWNKVLNNDATQYRIVLGARSSVFLPFQDLGLIIVDEVGNEELNEVINKKTIKPNNDIFEIKNNIESVVDGGDLETKNKKNNITHKKKNIDTEIE
jgi:hypothetical protein